MNKPRPALNVSLEWLFASSTCYSATFTGFKLFAKSWFYLFRKFGYYGGQNLTRTPEIHGQEPIGPSSAQIPVGGLDCYLRLLPPSLHSLNIIETNLFGIGFVDPSTSIGQCKSAGISLKVKPSAPLSKPFIGFHNISINQAWLKFRNFRKNVKTFPKEMVFFILMKKWRNWFLIVALNINQG